MTFDMMGGDERARKDSAERLKAMINKYKLDEEIPHLPQNIDDLKIPDELVDDVLGRMCGPVAGKGQRISFIGGPWDGCVEFMKWETMPAVFQVFLSTHRDIARPSNVAVSVFYDVAVYDLQCTPEGIEFYRFAGFSYCMEGLQMRDGQ